MTEKARNHLMLKANTAADFAGQCGIIFSHYATFLTHEHLLFQSMRERILKFESHGPRILIPSPQVNQHGQCQHVALRD